MLSDIKKKLETGDLEVWSCDPSAIKPWSEEAKARLNVALADIFGWEKDDETKEQDGRAT